MFKNYLTVAVRNIRRQKLYTTINVAGLAIGMASSILILLFVFGELSIDKFHKHADSIYRVYAIIKESGEKLPVALTPKDVAGALKKDLPEVVNSVCLARGGNILLKYTDQWFNEKQVGYTYPSFFEIFSLSFVRGNAEKALSEPNSIVLAESLAKKIFKAANPIGKTLHVKDIGDLMVTAIIKDKKNSHIRSKAILPFHLYKDPDGEFKPWSRYHYTSYVLLEKDANFEAVNQKVADYLKINVDPKTTLQFQLQPLKEIWLHSHLFYDFFSPPYDIRVIYMLVTVAAFILLTACMNYMNLATVQSERRTKEVGLRRVVGAGRVQIMLQFLGESVLLSCISLIFAIILAEIFLPGFNNLIEIKELVLFDPNNLPILLLFLTVAVVTGTISGSYPALFISSFQPAAIMNRKIGKGARGALLQKIFIVSQFIVSIVLIITTVTLYRQVQYMQGKDLGYDPQNLIYIPITENIRQRYDHIKTNLLLHPEITHVTSVMNLPTWRGPSAQLAKWEGNSSGKKIWMYHGSVDHDFIDTFQMQILRGRNFAKGSSADAKPGLILNEAAVRLMELEDPIGKQFSMWNHEGQIIGVVKDFHFNNVKYKVDPIVLKIAPTETRWMIIRVLPGNISETLSFIENIWRRVEQDFPFSLKFLDKSLDEMYLLEQKMAEVFSYGAALAIFIACLGLFGLSAFTSQRRTKELAIRKTCGASLCRIVSLLSAEFVKLVLIANLIAWPIAYFALNQWLRNYAYRIDICAGSFLLSAFLALIIALITVGYQAIKAARANPVEALRYE
jgi:putative ABC transport system permease protein